MELKTFEKENRYIVIKRSDLNLMTRTQEEVDELDHILYAIQSHRTIGLGKPPLKCVVVESDWPEYELVWKMIQDRMEGRTPSPSACKASPSGCKSESVEKVIAAVTVIASEHPAIFSDSVDELVNAFAAYQRGIAFTKCGESGQGIQGE